MARLSIDMPGRYAFLTELEVRVGDVNYGGHLGNDALLALAQEARLRWLGSLGFSEIDAGGAGLILKDLTAVFRAEAFLGDRLQFEIAAVRATRGTFDLFYRVTRLGDGAAVADLRTGMAFFDYSRRRPARMPPRFEEALGAG